MRNIFLRIDKILGHVDTAHNALTVLRETLRVLVDSLKNVLGHADELPPAPPAAPVAPVV